jgi:hypothetical protein
VSGRATSGLRAARRRERRPAQRTAPVPTAAARNLRQQNGGLPRRNRPVCEACTKPKEREASMGEGTEGTYGRIFAYGVLLSLLVEKVKENDPTFEDQSRRSFDIYLGQYFAKVGSAGPMETAAREMFNTIISSPIRMTPQTVRRELERPRPRTLRRRFLNWLERG